VFLLICPHQITIIELNKQWYAKNTPKLRVQNCYIMGLWQNHVQKPCNNASGSSHKWLNYANSTKVSQLEQDKRESLKDTELQCQCGNLRNGEWREKPMATYYKQNSIRFFPSKLPSLIYISTKSHSKLETSEYTVKDKLICVVELWWLQPLLE